MELNIPFTTKRVFCTVSLTQRICVLNAAFYSLKKAAVNAAYFIKYCLILAIPDVITFEEEGNGIPALPSLPFQEPTHSAPSLPLIAETGLPLDYYHIF